MTEHHDRHVAIIFHKVAADPDAIALTAGYEDVTLVRAGDIVGRRPSPDNRITWRFPIFNDDTWDYGIAGIVMALGGEERLRQLRDQVAPGSAWLRLCAPIIGSPWQESGGLGLDSVILLGRLGLAFDLCVFDYDEARPTHGLRPDRP